MAVLLQTPFVFLVDEDGNVREAAKLYTWRTGTSTPVTTYRDSSYTQPHDWPVLSEGGGLFPPIYLNPDLGDLKVQFKDSADNPIQNGLIDPYPANIFAELTAGWLGEKFIPRSAAEIAAGVTPTAYQYRHGSVRRYGAVGGGVNDTAAIAQAFAVAAYSGNVFFDAIPTANPTLYLTDDIVVKSGITVECEPNVWVKKASGTGTNTFLFRCDNYAFGATSALTANATPSAKVVSVASGASFSVGQQVLLRDSTYAYGTSYQNQEIHEIESISSNDITLKTRVMGSFATASSAELVAFSTPNRNITFKNVRGIIPAGVGGGIFYANYATNVRLINCEGEGAEKRSVQYNNCTNCTIEGGYFHDGQDVTTAGNGYGYTFGNSRNCHALGVRTKNIRENSLAGGTAFCSIRECYDEGAQDSSWNTHADGNHDNLIADNTSIGAYAKAIVIGFDSGLAADYRNIVRNNTILNCGATGIESYSTAGTEQRDNVIEGNTIDGYARTTANKYGIYIGTTTRPKVLNNKILNGTTTNALAGIRVEGSTTVLIDGNLVDGVPSGTAIRHNNCTGITLSNNKTYNMDAASPGIFASSTASTVVRVLNNVSGNDVAFTLNSGDIHRGNIYATKFDEDKGATSVADGGTVAHKCIRTPTQVVCTAPTSGEFVAVTAISSSNFTVAIKTHSNGAGTTAAINWMAS